MLKIFKITLALLGLGLFFVAIAVGAIWANGKMVEDVNNQVIGRTVSTEVGTCTLFESGGEAGETKVLLPGVPTAGPRGLETEALLEELFRQGQHGVQPASWGGPDAHRYKRTGLQMLALAEECAKQAGLPPISVVAAYSAATAEANEIRKVRKDLGFEFFAPALGGVTNNAAEAELFTALRLDSTEEQQAVLKDLEMLASKLGERIRRAGDEPLDFWTYAILDVIVQGYIFKYPNDTLVLLDKQARRPLVYTFAHLLTHLNELKEDGRRFNEVKLEDFQPINASDVVILYLKDDVATVEAGRAIANKIGAQVEFRYGSHMTPLQEGFARGDRSHPEPVLRTASAPQ